MNGLVEVGQARGREEAPGLFEIGPAPLDAEGEGLETLRRLASLEKAFTAPTYLAPIASRSVSHRLRSGVRKRRQTGLGSGQPTSASSIRWWAGTIRV